MELVKQKAHSNEDILKDFKEMCEDVETMIQQQTTKPYMRNDSDGSPLRDSDEW